MSLENGLLGILILFAFTIFRKLLFFKCKSVILKIANKQKIIKIKFFTFLI